MFASEVFWSNARKRCLSSPPDQKPPIGEAVITGSLRGQSTTARDLMTVRTAYPYRTLRLWTSGDQPVLDVWLGYTPVDAEQKSNRTFIVLCVRPKIPGLLELAWPVPAWFTNRVFAEDCEIVEMEQSAYNHQGRDLKGISSDPRSQETVGGIGAAARSTFRPWALSGTFQTGTGPRCADPTNRYS